MDEDEEEDEEEEQQQHTPRAACPQSLPCRLATAMAEWLRSASIELSLVTFAAKAPRGPPAAKPKAEGTTEANPAAKAEATAEASATAEAVTEAKATDAKAATEVVQTKPPPAVLPKPVFKAPPVGLTHARGYGWVYVTAATAAVEARNS